MLMGSRGYFSSMSPDGLVPKIFLRAPKYHAGEANLLFFVFTRVVRPFLAR